MTCRPARSKFETGALRSASADPKKKKKSQKKIQKESKRAFITHPAHLSFFFFCFLLFSSLFYFIFLLISSLLWSSFFDSFFTLSFRSTSSLFFVQSPFACLVSSSTEFSLFSDIFFINPNHKMVLQAVDPVLMRSTLLLEDISPRFT